MVFKSVDNMLNADPRYSGTVVHDAQGLRQADMAGHHAKIAELTLKGSPPGAVRASFDRTRNIFLYSWFDYELLLVAELLACTTFEFALKHRLRQLGQAPKKQGTLRVLMDKGRSIGLLPKLAVIPGDAAVPAPPDAYEAMLILRNDFAHGTADIHTPAMAFQFISFCTYAINALYPPK